MAPLATKRGWQYLVLLSVFGCTITLFASPFGLRSLGLMTEHSEKPLSESASAPPLLDSTDSAVDSGFADNLRKYPSFVFASDESKGSSVKRFLNLDLPSSSDGMLYDLFFYRVVRVPYDGTFPKVLKTGQKGPTRWALRMMTHLQQRNASGPAEWRSSCSPAWKKLQLSITARFMRPLSSSGEPWQSECSSSVEAISSSALFFECPMPKESWSHMGNVSKDTLLELDLRYQDGEGLDKPLGKVSLVVEQAVGSGHNLAICSGPLYGVFEWEKWVEYIEYHRLAVGVEHFFLYSYVEVDVEDAARDEMIRHYEAQGLLTYVAWTRRLKMELSYQNAYTEQSLMYTDCLLRNKFRFKWLGFFDLDEYISVRPLKGVSDADSFSTLLAGSFVNSAALRFSRKGFTTDRSPTASTSLQIDLRQNNTGIWATAKSMVSPAKTRSMWVHYTTDFEEPSLGISYVKDFEVPIEIAYVAHYRPGFRSPDTSWVEDPAVNIARWAPHLVDNVREVLDRLHRD